MLRIRINIDNYQPSEQIEATVSELRKPIDYVVIPIRYTDETIPCQAEEGKDDIAAADFHSR